MNRNDMHIHINNYLFSTRGAYESAYREYLESGSDNPYKLEVSLSDAMSDSIRKYLFIDGVLADAILTAGFQGFRYTNKELKKLNPFLKVRNIQDAKLRERLNSRFGRPFSYETELFRLRTQVTNILEITNEGIIKSSEAGWGEQKTLAYIKQRIIDRTETQPWKGVLDYQINRAARTETLRAWSIGEDTAFFESDARSAGIIKYWKSADDKRTRRDHRDWNGIEADSNGVFTLQSYTGEVFRTTAPRLGMVPREVINCRCTVGYKLKED